MRAWYLLLGLMICVAGAGTVNSSDGYLADQNPTPFLISGHVLYEDGSPCNNPIVNITNLDTGAAWCTDVVPGYNYYHALLGGVNASVGDLLEFDVTDGVVSGTANHTVDDGGVGGGGIFINLTLPQPPSLVDITVASAHSDSNATEPILFMVCGWVFYENRSGCTGAVVNITNLNTGVQWTAETHPGHYYYQLVLDAANVSVGNVLQIDASRNDQLINSTRYNITYVEVSDGAAMIDLNEGSIDLTVSMVSPPRDFYANTNNTVTAVMANGGTAYTEGFEAAFFADELLMDTVDAPSIGPGNDRSVNFNWAPDHEGDYTIVVMADYGRTIDETDETNNNRSVDLHVEFINIDPAITDLSLNKTPLDGDIIHVGATIENMGGDLVENVTVAFYDTNKAFHTEIINLNAGDSRMVSTCWDASYGEHDIKVMIDPDNTIWELDETNNQRSLSMFVNASRDFTIMEVFFAVDGQPCNSSELEWGQTVTITAIAQTINLANRDCSVKIQFESVCDTGEWELRSLINATELLFEPGTSVQSVTVEWHIAGDLMGNMSVAAVVDLDDEIHEPDESNNEIVVPVYVKTCDFTVTNITANPDLPIFGETVELNATIENLGDVAGSTNVIFMVNSTNTPGNRDLSVRNVSVDAGGKEYVSIYWNTSETNLGGACTALAKVDPYNKIPEVDETNNTLYTELFVNGTDLDVTEIGILDEDDSDLYIGDVLEINAAITNHGAIDADEFVVEFYDNDALFHKENVSELESGGTHKIEVEWDFSDAISGEHSLNVTIDTCENPENNLANNVESYGSVEVSSPWHVTNISFDPEEPDEGMAVTVTATVENEAPYDRTVDVYFYTNDRQFHNVSGVMIRGYTTKNITAVLKDVRATFPKPDYVRSTCDIRVKAGDHEPEEILQINTPENLTVFIEPPTNAIYNEITDVNIRVTNDGDETAKTTLWFYDVNESYYEIDAPSIGSETLNISYPGASNISVNLTETHKRKYYGDVVCAVYDKDGNQLFIRDDTVNNTHKLTRWGSGDAVSIYYAEAGTWVKLNYIALLDTIPLTIPAHSSQEFKLTWRPQLGEHTLWARVSSANNSTSTPVTTQDLWVANISVNPVVSDGDLLNVTATIGNIGNLDAGAFMVSFSNDSNVFCVRNLSGSDMSGGDVVVNALWEASTWNESEGKVTLDHTISVEIDPCENFDGNESNNNVTKIVRVDPSRDFSVANITFVQEEETNQTTIGALIKNYGSAGSTNISIMVDKWGKSCSVYSTSLWIDGERYVNVEWNASVAGNCSIRVVTDPDNRTLELNESNNNASRSVYIGAPDFIVKSLVINPFDLVGGDATNITATVANVGDRPANVSLAVYDYRRVSEESIIYWTATVGLLQPAGDRGHAWADRDNATAMRLYLEYETSNKSHLRLYDSKNRLISVYNASFIGWTDWVVGDTVIAEIEKGTGRNTDGPKVDIYKYDYLAPDDIIGIKNAALLPADVINITVNWNATAGERSIVAIVDYNDVIPELAENNGKSELLTVQGADLIVSDMQLTANGTEITDIISLGTVVNISATVTNIGILPANGFNVSFVCDDIHDGCVEIANVTSPNLNPGNSTRVFATWNVTDIGDYMLDVIADPENNVFETSELNNTLSKSVVVRGPDLSVTDVTFEVVPPVGADTNVTGNAVYDTDTVLISAVIENQGIMQADNFNTHLFYEYEYLGGFSKRQSGGSGVKWINKSYDGAECIYINVTNLDCNINGRLVVYGGDGTEVVRPNESCWVPVMGDAANVRYSRTQDLRFIVDFHAGNITKIEGQSLAVGESMSVFRIQRAGTGDHPVIVCADPENNVWGDPDDDNYANITMCVLPSRDFIPEMRLIRNGSEIGVNDTVWGGDTVTVDTRIRMDTDESDPYSEYRKGIVNVTIIDEHEWVGASPRYELTSYGYAYIISYPGVDEIRLHFNKLDVSRFDFLEIRDENGTLLCTINSYTPVSPWLSGDKVYVYRVRKETRYGVYRHIECSIDKYQYRKINRSTVELTANKTANISPSFTPSAGAHTIYVITDPDDEIGELNESNNMANTTIDVKACRDPAAVNIMFSPDKPRPGDAVNVTATITNNGNRTATFAVDLSATKYEHRPCESPHYGADPVEFQENIITYPEANWIGVHFTKISTRAGPFASYLQVCDRDGWMSEDYYGYEGGNVWTWVNGSHMEINTRLFCTREGDCIWGFGVDTVAHKVTLNKTTRTLPPGKTASINGTLPDVRIGNRSIGYTVTAAVDQDHIIFETDESNNMISRALIASCPDLTVSENLHFTGDSKARAKIKNAGTDVAEDVEVRFGRDTKFPKRDTGRRIKLPKDNPDHPDDDDIDAIRVHFQELTIRSGSLRIRTSATGSVLQKYTSGDYDDTWSDWVTGDYLRIYYDRGVDFTIDRYAYAKNESVGNVPADGTKRWEIPWTGYEEPYNLTIDVDPAGGITESNEDNNNATIEMGADISMRAHTIPDYLMVDHPLNFIIQISNGGTLPTPEKFNVTLYDFTHGKMVPLENHTIEKLNPRDYCYVKFEWEPPTSGGYKLIIRADPEDSVAELNEKDNELTLYSLQVFKDLGYAGSSLETYTDGEVNGSFIFKMGDRVGEDNPDHWYGVLYRGSDTYKVGWNIPLPADASIRIARLYLYWGYASGYTQPTEFNVEFNDHLLAQDPGYPDYSDYPIEEGTEAYHNYAYGVYCYDVKDHVTGVDGATVTTRDLHGAAYVCIAGMSLVIVYESDDGILTRYWINEGADVLGCGGADMRFSSLSPDDCTTEVVFEGKADSDGLSNATLITVVPWGNHGNERVDEEFYRGTEWAGKRKNGLYFNGKELKDGAYVCDSNVDSVGIDERDVKDDLVKRGNVAEIQDRGDGMMLSVNGFLILRYPPDLNVIDLNAPKSTVVGAHHPINVTIRNDGKGGAHDFNVTLHIDGKQMVRIPHIDLPAGNSTTIHLYNWTPKMLGHVYNLTAAADVLSGEDWTEIETDNNAMTKRVMIEEGGFGNQTGPRGIGGGSNPTGGEYTEKITGRVMQGMKEFLSLGGGGGAGMFSLTEWIMKGAVWLTLLLFVCTGYFMEQRSYGRVRVPGYARGL